MKLEELSLSIVTKAVDEYLELAYGSTAVTRDRPDRALPEDAPLDEVLGLFQREVVESGAEENSRTGPSRGGDSSASRREPLSRFTMRLGNRNYPFMKLLMQEHIVPGEFYFAVDTHDEMEIKPDFPDYDAWSAVRKFNQELKRQIEGRFAELGLPTAVTIRELCAARRSRARPVAANARILIVDDEEDLADAVGEVLESRGYRPSKVHDGPAALEAVRRLQPDMVLLDYELPEMDGLEVIGALREDPATRDVPVLLCTASKIAVADMRKADAFLAKPFQEDLLCEMVERVLSAGRQKAPR